jgi:tRNA nucleotidyltransferase (CCA-adding enzyme)
MREDRLRALRAIRFAARFDFALDDATRRAIETSAPFLDRLSRERVKQELDKTMEQVRRPSAALATWKATGAFRALIPALDRVDPAAFAVVDCLAMPGLARRPARRAIRFAGLLSPLAAKEAARVLVDLKASKVEINLVSTLLDRWHSLGAEIETVSATGRPSDEQVRRWVATIGRLQLGSFMRLASAVWAAGRGASLVARNDKSARGLYRRMLKTAWRDPIDLGSLAVDGDDLRRGGIPPGPALGRILQALLESVVADPARNTADWLLQEAQRLSDTMAITDRRKG